MEFLEFSLESFRDESLKLAKLVDSSSWAPDCIAYLAKGAWQIGKVCADFFDVPIVELSAHRSGEAVKTNSRWFLRVLPKNIRKILREVEIKRRLSALGGSNQKKTMMLTRRYELPSTASRILIVDDAADSGASLVAAKGLLSSLVPQAEIRTAVITSFGPARATGVVDYSLHEDLLLCSPMSKDNKDYSVALSAYKATGDSSLNFDAKKGV